MSGRKIVFKNFRNFGFNEETELILNHDINLENIGDLVTLIGPNNSGKSNILRGVEKITIGKLDEDDVTELVTDTREHEPEIDLCVQTDKGVKYNVKIDEFGSKISKIENGKFVIDEVQDFISLVPVVAEKYKKLWTKEYGIWSGDGYYNVKSDYYSLINAVLTEFPNSIIKDENFDILFQKFILELYETEKYNSLLSNQMKNNAIIKSLLTNEQKSLSNLLALNKTFLDEFFDNFGMNLIPNVFVCNDANLIKDEDLVSGQNKEGKIIFSPFLLRILNLIDSSAEDFEASWKTIKIKKTHGKFKELEKDANKKLQVVANEFNRIYNDSKNRYNFRLGVDKESIYFYMEIDNTSVILSRQSEGFKWFFNFFFNFLLEKRIEPGDIVIIDEVGSKLHYQGIKELHDFLKKYAVEHKITFVLATHSPAFIDNDSLEELRVIKTHEDSNESTISNEFTMYEDKDPNVLTTIKYALTVEQHVIMNPENKVIFVEGVTDYNYLTAMKNIFPNSTNVHFLPIQGVAKSSDAVKKLKTIRRKPLFLVDGDKAGKMFENKLETDEYSVMTLTAIDGKFKDIEDLFSKDDMDKFKLEKKKYGKAYIFKKQFDVLNISEETKKNFEKVFDKIQEMN